MNIFGKLLGKKPGAPKAATTSHSTSADLRRDPNLIRVFDEYGQELFVSKDQWRIGVLPGALEAAWNDPEQLYGIVAGAIGDGFTADVLKASEQLYRIDPTPARSTCVYAVVLTKNGRTDDAEHVLTTYLQAHGDDGYVLTNLAKVYADRGQRKKCDETLWHALEVDPNQENALSWYAATCRERGGEESALEAFRRVAALALSWRAQLWVARAALQAHDLDSALTNYRESLLRVGNNVPPDLLMQMSGDLGNAGHLEELVRLTEPHFVAASHGLQVGNNLLKAHLDLGQLDSAQRMLNELYSLQRPDWKETLGYWDTEIAKAKLSVSPVNQATPLQVSMRTSEDPIWLKPSSLAANLFRRCSPDGPVVCFLGSSAEVASNSGLIERQLPDTPGRLSRAVPLFLAEQVAFGSDARVRTLVPWITAETGGFVLSGVAWSNEDAARYSRQGEKPSDYVVVTHLKTKVDPWAIELRLVRAGDGACLDSFSMSFTPPRAGEAIRALAQRLLDSLGGHAGIELRLPDSNYEVPEASNFSDYLLRLEQLLAVRCSVPEDIKSGFLSGEREIIDGNIQLCLACATNVTTRVLLIQTLSDMRLVRPEIVAEYKNRIMLLQKENPLREPAQGVIYGMLNDAFAA
jgi:tetratricopeptide (TPR) repeat protein